MQVDKTDIPKNQNSRLSCQDLLSIDLDLKKHNWLLGKIRPLQVVFKNQES